MNRLEQALGAGSLSFLEGERETWHATSLEHPPGKERPWH